MKLLKFAILGSCCLFWLRWQAIVWAGPVVFSDDFSQGLSNWQPVRDDGSLWSLVDGKAQALVTVPSTITELIPKDEVWDSAWKNIEYSLEFTPLEGVDKNVSFVFQNLTNWYELHFLETYVNLVRIKNGQAPFWWNTDFQMINGQTYQITIRFNQGHITVTINDQEIIDTVDWSFDGNFGKIGLKAGTGWAFPTRVLYDNVVVRLLDTAAEGLQVPLFKQHDPQWADQEYDSATSWSTKPSIRRWGCALTSAVMILHYHGITQLPNGQNLDPSSLNNWLKTQADGYLGQGALNWIAVTRLTRLVSSHLQTPKLEYQRHNGPQLDQAKTEITHQKPVILEIEGHFLVADGVTDNQDLLIKDPAYSFERFSQHHKSLLSTRTFQPSQTDLSYLLLAYGPELEVSLTTMNGQAIPEVQIYTEYLTDQLDGSNEHTQPLVHQTLAKPTTGRYLLKLKQPTFQPYEIQILAYDTEGTPTVLTQKGWVGPQPIEWIIDYGSDQPSRLRPTGRWASLRHHLKMVYRFKSFKLVRWYHWLDTTMAAVERQPAKHRRKYLVLLQNYLKVAQWWLKPSAYTYLDQQLRALETSLD